jgi:hypothetical protein
LAFFILKMLGNVRVFLEKFEMAGTKKAQFQMRKLRQKYWNDKGMR